MKYNSNDLLQKCCWRHSFQQIFYLLYPLMKVKLVTLGEDFSLHCWCKLEKELMTPPRLQLFTTYSLWNTEMINNVAALCSHLRRSSTNGATATSCESSRVRYIQSLDACLWLNPEDPELVSSSEVTRGRRGALGRHYWSLNRAGGWGGQSRP